MCPKGGARDCKHSELAGPGFPGLCLPARVSRRPCDMSKSDLDPVAFLWRSRLRAKIKAEAFPLQLRCMVGLLVINGLANGLYSYC